MINITLLSLTITGSFQRSPLILVSFSTVQSFHDFENIKTNYFLSSFLINHAISSSSIIKDSIFNHFITSNPVLAFSTIIENQTFYGNSIPKDENLFYRTNYEKIINCKFMSITDNTQEQLLPDVGLCIYTTKNTTVDSCYFFAILSYRSGSCIEFDSVDYLTNSVVTNSVFKSITQHQIGFGSFFLTGGAISHGRAIVDNGAMYAKFLSSSITDHCCFEKVRLVGSIFNARQLGIITYLSRQIKLSNLNFTDDEMGGESQQYGTICVYCQQESLNDLSYINLFNSDFYNYGIISVIFMTKIEMSLSLSYSNLINNSIYEDYNCALIGLEIRNMKDTSFDISNIQCNCEYPFFGITDLYFKNDTKPVNVNIQNSVFKIPESMLCGDDAWSFKYIKIVQHDNQFNHNSFNLVIKNDIISNFGYIQTSIFTSSNTFSYPYIRDEESYYTLKQDNSSAVVLFAILFGIISFIVFIFFLCVRKSGAQNETKLINQFTTINEDISELENIEQEEYFNEKNIKEDEYNKKLSENIENHNSSDENHQSLSNIDINEACEPSEKDDINTGSNTNSDDESP